MKNQTTTQDKWATLATDTSLETVVAKLKEHNMDAQVVETGAQAKEALLAMIPEGSEVFQMTSVTLDTIGVSEVINESVKYKAVRKELNTMDRSTQGTEMRKLGASPDFAVGSAHAVTEDGSLVIASNTGSQLAGYVYGAGQVIFVIGAQKVVKNLDEAMQRIYEHTLPLESARARKAYGQPDSFVSNVSKVLIIHKETNPDRIKVILVKEVLGF